MGSLAKSTQPLLGGEDVRITRTPHGTLYNAKRTGGFQHPWRVLVSNETATVYPGMINGQEPTILDQRTGNKLPLSNRPSPHLRIGSFNKNIGWIALELTVDKTYHKIIEAEVVQSAIIVGSELTTNNPFFFYGLPGIPSSDPDRPKVRYPLARLERVGAKSYNVYQVAMFNLNWIAKPPQPQGAGTAATAGQGALPRHFFWPS